MKIVEQYLHEYHYATRVYPFIEPDVNPSWEGHLTVRFPTKLDQYDDHSLTEPVLEIGNWKLALNDVFQLQIAIMESVRLMVDQGARFKIVAVPAPAESEDADDR